MKFHSITVENLNSLYGEHTIDFEEDVRNAPLFLIVGPTGAGKSTLLDGVSLALFGKTPRLEQQRGVADTDVGHIMSVGTAHCRAELVFSVRSSDGTRETFRATWSCRRAHDKADGTLQRPERSLEHLEEGRWKLVVSDHRNKEIEGPFAQALRGLTVEDFRRTILLAQGDFAALLHASDDEKAAILERLTNTEVYQEIGARAAHRRRDTERAYHALRKELEQTEVLDTEAREQLETELAEVGDAVELAQSNVAELEAEVDLGKQAASLEKAIDDAVKRFAATEKAMGELRPKVERLELDRLFRPLEAAFRELEASEEAVSELEEATSGAKEALEKLDESKAELLEARNQVRDVEKACEEKWEKLEPKLEAAARVEAQLVPAREELQSALEHQKAAAEAKENASNQLGEAEKRATAIRHRLTEVADAALAFPDTAALDGLKTRVDVHFAKVMVPLYERLDELGEEDDRGEGANLSTLRARQTRTRNQLAEVAGDLSALDELGTMLAGEIASLREKRDALTEATYAMEALKQREEEKGAATDQIELLDKEISAAKERLAAAKELAGERRERVDDLRTSVKMAEQVIALGDLRDHLEDGEPCPLCGSPIHPFCLSDEIGAVDDEARSERDRVADRLEQAERALAEQERKVSLEQSGVTAKLASRQHHEGTRVEVVQKLEQTMKKFAQAAEKGGFPPLEVWNLRQGDRLANALEAADEDLTKTERRAEKLRQRRSDWERAVEELRIAEQAESDTEAMARLIDETEAQLVARLEDLIGFCEPLEIDPPETTEREAVEAYVRQSLERIEAAAAAHNAVASTREKVERAAKAAEAASEELERGVVALTGANENLERRQSSVRELEKALAEALPEGSPAEMRQQRREELEEHRSAVEKARKALEEVQSKRDKAAGTLNERREKLEAARKRRSGASEAWEALRADHEVSRADVAEGLLDTEARQKLEEEVTAARERRERAKGAVESAQKALQEFLEEHGELDIDVEAVERERDRVRAWRDAFTQHRGALMERKQQDDRRRASVNNRQDELAARRADYERWRTIASLIGTGEGAAFRTFAQSLNLQGLVDRANARLKHLAPRYELAVARGEQGEPTLNFAVRDGFRAGHERPLTTLSGGETFLVSLALALALSDYRRIELPVETLLLDEGFGTLDQDALHMAVDTLQRLHQDSTRQVGIISHVEALKEMIDARIIVEKEGNGRSTLRFDVGGVRSDQPAPNPPAMPGR